VGCTSICSARSVRQRIPRRAPIHLDHARSWNAMADAETAGSETHADASNENPPLLPSRGGRQGCACTLRLGRPPGYRPKAVTPPSRGAVVARLQLLTRRYRPHGIRHCRPPPLARRHAASFASTPPWVAGAPLARPPQRSEPRWTEFQRGCNGGVTGGLAVRRRAHLDQRRRHRLS
jgi:hypothetical protein